MRAAVALVAVAVLAALVAAGASGSRSKLRYTGTYTSSTGGRFGLTITVRVAPAVRRTRTKAGRVQLRPDPAAITLSVRNLATRGQASVIAPPVSLEVDALYRVPRGLGGGYAAISAPFASARPLTLRAGATATIPLDRVANGARVTVPATQAAAFERLFRGTPAYLLVGAFGAAFGEHEAVRAGTACRGYVLAFAARKALPVDAAVCGRLTSLRRR